jgi:hypothetical protein
MLPVWRLHASIRELPRRCPDEEEHRVVAVAKRIVHGSGTGGKVLPTSYETWKSNDNRVA